MASQPFSMPSGTSTLRLSWISDWAATAIEAAIMVAQIGALWGISAGGTMVAFALHLPVPGNVIGLVALFLGLATGTVKMQWFDRGGGFLTKHLAFFFVPVTVGVMAFGATFARAGFGIIVALFVSTVLGLAVAGFTTERLARRRNR